VGRTLVLLGLFAALGCASPLPSQLTGSLTYRERMALPEGAVARVTLLDVSAIDMAARVVAEREIRPSGQVPIPFTLAFAPGELEPDHRYGLRATISDANGKLLFTTATALPVLTRDAPSPVEVVLQRALAATPGGARVFAYECADLRFRVEVTPDHALLFSGGQRTALPHVAAASGAKYSDGTTTFWSHGDEALLVLGGVEHAGCRVRPLYTP